MGLHKSCGRNQAVVLQKSLTTTMVKEGGTTNKMSKGISESGSKTIGTDELIVRDSKYYMHT